MIDAKALDDFPALLGKPTVRNVLFRIGLLQETVRLGSFSNFDVFAGRAGMIEAEALEDFPALLGKRMVRNVLFRKGLLLEIASLGSFCNNDVLVEPVGAVDNGVPKGLQEKRLETMACNPLPRVGLL